MPAKGLFFHLSFKFLSFYFYIAFFKFYYKLQKKNFSFKIIYYQNCFLYCFISCGSFYFSIYLTALRSKIIVFILS